VRFALFLVLLAQANHFSKDLNVETVVLGFEIDFLFRFVQFLDLFFDLFDALNDHTQLISSDFDLFAHSLLPVDWTQAKVDHL